MDVIIGNHYLHFLSDMFLYDLAYSHTFCKTQKKIFIKCGNWVLYRYFVKPALSLYTKVSGQALLYDNGQKSCMDAGANAAYRFSQCLEHRNQVFPLQVYLPTVERQMVLACMNVNVFAQLFDQCNLTDLACKS